MGDFSLEGDPLEAGQLVLDTEESMEIAELDANPLSEQELVQNVEPVSYQFPALFPSRTLIELSNSSWSRSVRARDEIQPYLRGCKWSPDGTCCLSVVNNDGVHVTELPRDLYEGTVNSDRLIDVLDSVIHVKESGLVYDFCWYPGMNSSVPESCSWLTTSQNAPIQMWDAFDGSLRSTYRGFNAVDEVEAAISVTFSYDGAQIIAGYKKCFRTFNVDRPGRDFLEHKIHSPASCLATNNNLIASGSWNTSISLYSTEGGTYKSIGKMHGHSGGVTHIKFTPDGTKLVSGARKDHRLLVWDIRYYRRPLNILSRAIDTNQRVYFDISPCGKYLVTGSTDGVVKVWDVEKHDWQNSLDAFSFDDNATHKATKYECGALVQKRSIHLGKDLLSPDELREFTPKKILLFLAAARFPLHRDCCNSISIHPFRPVLATGSGQLHLKDPVEDSSPDEPPNAINDTQTDARYSLAAENSLVFWWTGEVPELT